MKLLNIDSEFKRLDRELEVQVREMDRKRVGRLMADLVEATPIDTGFARSRWKMTPSKKGFDITNDAPYIFVLNNGHSKQAPRLFVEGVALRYGVPNGSIVETTK